jgi:4-diphosphocytidyl-2-C-methyl-D-erythritol kinase
VTSLAFKLPSFAKVNWSLRILGRRPDGYHELRTLLQTISLRDDLLFSQRETSEVALTCSDPGIPLDDRNLIIRAAQALRERFGGISGATIHLEKRIPAQGGLGGASSNAAVALLGLSRLWNYPIDFSELNEIGSRIGADVPFFFVGGRALAGGTGTDVRAVADEERKHLVIINPNAGVSTRAAYEALQAPALTTSSEVSILSISRAEADLELSHLCPQRNDFEGVVFRLEPEIDLARKALLDVGAATVLLAGSGSSVFGVFESKQEQERAVSDLKAETGWRVFPAVTMSRSEYLQALGSCGFPLSRSE